MSQAFNRISARIAAARLVVAALLVTLLGATAAPATEGCDPLDFGLEFCWSMTTFTPIPGVEGQYSNAREGSDAETILYFFVIERPEGDLSYEDIFGWLLDTEAEGQGVPRAALELQNIYEVEIALQPAKQLFFHLPAAASPEIEFDSVHGRAVLITDEYVVIGFSFEEGRVHSVSHLGDSMVALAFVQPAGAAAPTPAAAPAPAADCDDLGAGVQLCGLRDLGWDAYDPEQVGTGARVNLALGETSATILAQPHDGYSPPISEEARRDLQGKLHSQLVSTWLERRGTAPQDAYIGHVLGVRAGADENAALAQLETYYIARDGGFETFGITVLLGPDHYVLVVSMNPGEGASEDHFFLVEELMRGISLPG